MYVSVEEVKAAGLCADKSDPQITAYIKAASAKIDRWTGLFFEPRPLTVILNGGGGRYIFLPYCTVELTSVTIDGTPAELSGIYLTQDGWALLRREGWPRGIMHITIVGTFGVVDENGEAPAPIKDAVLRLVVREAVAISDAESQRDLIAAGRVIAETTDGHSYQLASPSSVGEIGTYGYWTGDQAIDSIIAEYQRPPAIGAA